MITYDKDTNTAIIGANISGIGTIYDIEARYDIEIKMLGYKYFVCAPSYYNIRPTRHKTGMTATRAAKKLVKDGYEGVRVFEVVAYLDGYIVEEFDHELYFLQNN